MSTTAWNWWWSDKDSKRVAETVDLAFKQGNGQLMILDAESEQIGYYSRSLMDPATGLSYMEPAPHNFSFNSPLGACPHCKGLGYVNIIDRDKIIPDLSLSIRNGGILPLGKFKNVQIFWQISAICEKYGCTLDTPLGELPEEALSDILNGTNERLSLRTETLSTSTSRCSRTTRLPARLRSGPGNFSRAPCVPSAEARA